METPFTRAAGIDPTTKFVALMLPAIIALFSYLWGRIDKLEEAQAAQNVAVEGRLVRIETKIDRVLVARRGR